MARMVKNISCVGQAAEAIRAELEAMNRFDIRISRVIALSDTTTGLVNMFAAQVSYQFGAIKPLALAMGDIRRQPKG